MMTQLYPGLPWRRALPAVAAVVLAVCLSLFVFIQARGYEQARIAAECRSLAENRANAVQQIINRYLDILGIAAGLCDAVEPLSRESFTSFVRNAVAGLNGIQAVEFAPRITDGQRADFEAAARREEFVGFSITERTPEGMRPAQRRPEYVPVYFIAPLRGNEAALGFDLASDPASGEILRQARDNAAMTATGRVVLVQKTSRQFGVLIFKPLYGHQTPVNLENRRAALTGFVVGVFRISELVEAACQQDPLSPLNMRLLDASAAPGGEELYYRPARFNAPGGPASLEASFHMDIPVSVPSRTWVIRFTVDKSFTEGRLTVFPWMLLASGLTMSLLLGLYLRKGLKTLALTEVHGVERARTAEELRDKVEQLEKAHDAVKENEEILHKILLGIRAGIIVIDPADFTIMEVNAVAEEIIGVGRGDLVGKPWRAIDWREASGCVVGDTCVLDNRNWLERELLVKHPDGKVVPVVKTQVNGYRGGKFLVFEIIIDISERKALERQLNTAQKLESIGLLAAGIAHEINTPIQYIGDNLHFLQGAFDDLARLGGQADRLAEAAAGSADRQAALEDYRATREAIDLEFLGQEVPKALSQSREGVERVSVIVKAMKKFSHPGTGEKSAVDINEAVETTITVARNEWKYVAEMETDLDRELSPVYCLPGDFNQVVLNVLVNAAHAVAAKVKGTEDKGRIRVSTSRDDGYLKLDIADTGTGIPEEHRSKIFDPFFTTKEVGKGTGQGLAIAHQIIVEKHGGTIDFQSEVGVGTTFTIRIPFGKPA
jgi:PAS domain S-box-containing protein